jgi:hypothetical protein
MPARSGFLGGAGLIAALAMTAAACTAQPTAAPAATAPLTPIVTIKELMENVIDPIADNVFDAVASDVTAKGVATTVPKTDEEWAKVMQGAVTLAEGANLLKMPRSVAPPGDRNNSSGPNAPELSPAAIQAKIDGDRAVWNKHAEELRDVAVNVMAIVKERNAEKLFAAGSDLDMVCENCHLEYWYPGDRKAVLEDAAKRATMPGDRRK